MKHRVRASLVLLSVPAVFALAMAACSSIPAPAERAADAADLDAGDAGDADAAWAHCRGGGYRTGVGTGILMEGDVPDKPLLAVAGVFDEADAGRIIYQLFVTGEGTTLIGKPPVDLASPANSDFATCRYCAGASGDCHQVSSTGISCDTTYQAIAGEARVVQVPTVDGGTYWADLGNVVFAKVVKREGLTATELDTSDCLALSKITFQGTVLTLERPCAPEYAVYCQFADTASKR